MEDGISPRRDGTKGERERKKEKGGRLKDGISPLRDIIPNWRPWAPLILSILFILVFTSGSGGWWWEADSNHRRVAPADLQSAPVGHLGIPPPKIKRGKMLGPTAFAKTFLLINAR